jgi:hypothetical protein
VADVVQKMMQKTCALAPTIFLAQEASANV